MSALGMAHMDFFPAKSLMVLANMMCNAQYRNFHNQVKCYRVWWWTKHWSIYIGWGHKILQSLAERVADRFR